MDFNRVAQPKELLAQLEWLDGRIRMQRTRQRACIPVNGVKVNESTFYGICSDMDIESTARIGCSNRVRRLP